MSAQCRGCAGILISRLNRACLKRPLNSAPNIYLYICQYKPKGVLLGGQFACSRAGADQEIIVSVGEGEARFSHLLFTFYRVFQVTIPRELKFPRGRVGEWKLFRRCGVGMGSGGPHTYS